MTPPRATVDFTEIEVRPGLALRAIHRDPTARLLGWTIIAGAGKGPDGGRGIIATDTEITATGRDRIRRFVIQCKHYATGGRSVSPNDITNFHLMPEMHQCDGWLLVTSTQLTTNAGNMIKAQRKTSPQHDFDYWDSGRLRKLLMREECHKVFANSIRPLATHVLLIF